ncbi:hypothetical protein CCR75_004780 [Bremia lactucae]|uniref:Uncharacterized protein n=1 Tax=Bremia lactucae TaxID=4779 RepID=A0A976FNI4_BRELC|nr:hypothetical protein CCR75_004780 [Bremia lactucae]
MTSPRKAATAVPTRMDAPSRQTFTATGSTEETCARALSRIITTSVTKDAVKRSELANMRSQTCIEFLHIMKEFSESSCGASETVQRVDSLVSQDEQLLRLFPLSRTNEEDEAARRLRRALENEDEGMITRIAARDDDKELDAQDELQRWMDLDLGDLDHHMDVFHYQHPQPLALNDNSAADNAKSVALVSQIVTPTASPSMKRGVNGFLQQKVCQASAKTAKIATECLRESSAVNVCQRPNFSRQNKSVTASPNGINDVSLDLDLSSATLSSGSPLKRAKMLRSNNSHALRVSVSLNQAETDEEGAAGEDEEGNVWGMESDDHEHDLLSSIDHAVLCDRENRFLQWNLEGAQHQDQQIGNRSIGGMSIATNSVLRDFKVVHSPRSLHQAGGKIMAPSPTSSKSPSNVDIVEDWNSLDFGTFQNRTVSHILSSCLHKRKLHHPYKNQVQLVNFSVPCSGDTSSRRVAVPHPHQLGGSLATSLAFGGQQNGGGGDDGSPISGYVPLLASGHESNMAARSPGKGEKKTLRKREERKRLMTLKMQETFADLEGTFTEQDLDVKGIVGPGASLSKMALSKLENLPLPDLTNLPQDLRELKRKIEATEHKVEGTKHRHRKGGPCPRCQVQNQLRAAKRAYHKRAVAHKKLPQVVVDTVNDEAQEAANAQAAAAATLELACSVTAGLKSGTGVGTRKETSVTLTGGLSNSSGMLRQIQRPTACSVSSPSGSLCSTTSVSTSATVGSTSGSSSSSSCGGVSPPPSLSAMSVQSRLRSPCGKISSAAVPFSSPSLASISAISASSPSSPDTASPQLQHVTVTSG